MTLIKICGLQPGDDLSFSANAGISHVGFIFVPTSRRYIQPQAARALVDQLDASCQAVGVFVNEDPDTIRSIALATGLDVIQLHGAEPPSLCDELRSTGIQVWKALSIPTDAQQEHEVADLLRQAVLFSPHVDGLLFDAAPPKQAAQQVTGGHGINFSWQLVAPLIDLIRAQARVGECPQIWLAGGIRPDNMDCLLASFIPDGVDVSSGVEVDGRKSSSRIEALRKAVQRFVDHQDVS